jgi:hypothetical protein
LPTSVAEKVPLSFSIRCLLLVTRKPGTDANAGESVVSWSPARSPLRSFMLTRTTSTASRPVGHQGIFAAAFLMAARIRP